MGILDTSHARSPSPPALIAIHRSVSTTWLRGRLACGCRCGVLQLVETQHSQTAPASVAQVVYRNIREICDHKQKHEDRLKPAEKMAAKVAHFAGTTAFVYINAAFFAIWILLNVGLFGLKPFDPFPFVMLTTVVSLEAIFLSLFVLLSQNRMQRVADERSELDLQINLLAEHELTRLMIAVDLIVEKMGIELPHEHEKEELEADVKPADVLKEIEKENNEDDS